MKRIEKSGSGFKRDQHQPFELIENQMIIANMPEERFDHWGYLVYSETTSKLINQTLVSSEKISEN